MTTIQLAQADAIADAVLAHGRSLKFQPLTVAILDAGGHLVVLKRDDHSSLLRPEIATGKAWGALGLGFGGRELARRAERFPAFFTALNAMSSGRMVPVAGGGLIRDAAGSILGAIGVSGDTSDNDERCLIPAVASQGLIADVGDQLA
ncbi:MAG: heme-binding protein [Betaproteobacteria bacterium]|nr:heme-binding protein [Betaproteobacteria bacterium]